jgi:hypothetical protein
VALCAPLAAAIAVRTPLHLLLMRYRLRDRRRYYAKSFNLPSERHAAREQTAAVWTPQAAERRLSSSALGPTSAATSDQKEDAVDALSSPHHDDVGQSHFVGGGDDVSSETRRRQLRMARVRALPNHATHVRVSAARSTAAAMILASFLLIGSVVGGVLATRGWCAAAQARYNAAVAAALAVDALVMATLWVAAVWLRRSVLAEPRVVVATRLEGVGGRSAGNDGATADHQHQSSTTVRAAVLHEPYPVHNAWRLAYSS